MCKVFSIQSAPYSTGSYFFTLKFGDNIRRSDDLSATEKHWADAFFDYNVHEAEVSTPLTFTLFHRGEPTDPSTVDAGRLIGTIQLDLSDIQWNTSNKSWYLLNPPENAISSSSHLPRILIALDRYETELPLESTIFFGPSPSDAAYFQLHVTYPNLRIPLGDEIVVLTQVRDQRKDFTLTSDIGTNQIALHAWEVPGRSYQLKSLKPDVIFKATPTNKPGQFSMSFTPRKTGYIACRVFLNDQTVQERDAVIRICKGKGLFNFLRS